MVGDDIKDDWLLLSARFVSLLFFFSWMTTAPSWKHQQQEEDITQGISRIFSAGCASSRGLWRLRRVFALNPHSPVCYGEITKDGTQAG